jgi:hypothetical protein
VETLGNTGLNQMIILKAKLSANLIFMLPSRNSLVFEYLTISPLSLSHAKTSAIS